MDKEFRRDLYELDELNAEVKGTLETDECFAERVGALTLFLSKFIHKYLIEQKLN